MLVSRGSYKIALIVTSILYLMFAILSFIAYHGGSPAFPMDFNQVGNKYVTDMTPTSRISILWSLNVAYQFVWLIYCLVTLIRQGNEATIQQSYTITAYLVYCVLGVAWLFTWTRGNLYMSLAIIVFSQYVLCIAYGYACADLTYYLRYYAVTLENIRDVWCHRMLIQNGIMFTCAFNGVWCFLTANMFLVHELECDQATTSLVMLALLGISMITWFIVENTALNNQTQFTFSHYAVLIGAFISIHRRQMHQSEDPSRISVLVIGLLAITCLLACIRLLILFFKSYERTRPEGDMSNRQVRHDETGSTSVKVYRTFTSF